jgi:hypothetical protein
VLKWDVDEEGMGGDDAADAWRYGILTKQKRPAKAVPFRT